MEDLFINNIRLSDVKYKQKIGDTILGSCPNCGDNLKRESEFFITCASYPDCDFSCIDDYYYDNILKLSSERERISLKSNSKIKNEYAANDEISSNSISNHNYNKTNNQEKLQNDTKFNKTRPNNNASIEKSTINEIINYCNNCGEKINENTNNKSNKKKQNVKSSKPTNRGDILGKIIVIIIIISFIFSIILITF